MGQRTLSAGEFNHYPVRARDLAQDDDVIIESHGKPTAVLVSWERYRRLVGSERTPLDVIADPEAAEVEFDLPRFDEPARGAKL